MRQKLFLLFSIGCFLLTSVTYAQVTTINGTVKNENGEPVQSASVKIKLTTKGTLTDQSGQFTLQVAPGKILIISALGYEEKEVEAAQNLSVTLTATDAASAGTDVIVTANSIRREKRTLGYSAPIIKSDELMQGQSSSPISAISGRVPGVNITSSTGAPGGSSRIVLRGGSSIAGNNQALIVVDGVPVDNSSEIGGGGLTAVDFGNRGNDVNPEDIATMTILKGPAAAALYGSRASNGAVIITTKSGAGGNKKQEITVSSSNTFSSILKLPDFQNEYGQGYYKLDDDIFDGFVLDPRENGSWGPAFTGKDQEWGQEIDGKRLSKPYSALPDNIRNFFSTGFATDNNVSLASGSEKASYYLGLGSLNSNGIYPGANDTYNKYNVRFNGKAELSNKFSTSLSFNYNKIHQNQMSGGQAGGSILNNLYQTPRGIPIDEMGDLNNKYYGYGYTDADGIPHNDQYGYYGVYTMSPYYLLENYKNNNDVDRITGSFTIAYQPTSWLNIVERVGTDFYADRRESIEPKYDFTPIDPGTSGWYDAQQNLQTSNGLYQQRQINVTEINHDLMVTATHEFNSDFSGSLMVGNNIRQRKVTDNTTSTNRSAGLIEPGWYNLGNSFGPVYAINETETRRLIGLYADLNLAYKNYLFLDATARNDWSSTLPVQNNSFFYPSVSGSFIFTELTKGSGFNNIVNYGKLRASWAQVGNDANPYLLTTTYGQTSISDGFGSTQFPFNGIPGLMVGETIGNPNLKPEITTSYEIGTELSFLNSRLSLDFSYYTNKSKNQILNIPIPNSTGYESQVVNAGVIQNRGIELSLRGTPIKTTNFSLELFGTYYKNKSEVLSLMDGVKQVTIGGFNAMAIVAAVGHPYGEFYAVTNQTDGNGHTVVNPESGLPEQTASAEYLGSYNPDYQASFGGTAKYKNWALGFLFDTKQGGVFYSQTKSYIDFNGTALETGGDRTPHIWPGSVINTGTADEPVYEPNTDAKYLKQDYFGRVIPAGMNIVDGSFIKLRTLSLNYQVPKSALQKTPFGSLAIGLYGNNLFIWTPKSNQFVDPEMNSTGSGNEQGFDFGAQPSVRNYGVNLKLTF